MDEMMFSDPSLIDNLHTQQLGRMLRQFAGEAPAAIPEGGDLLDIAELTTLFGEPDSAQDAIAAWTGDVCYSTSGEPLPMWNPAGAAELHAAWRADADRIAAEGE